MSHTFYHEYIIVFVNLQRTPKKHSFTYTLKEQISVYFMQNFLRENRKTSCLHHLAKKEWVLNETYYS